MANYDDVVNFALRRGIFFPSSEIYANAPAGFYEFGPYGASIRRKLIELWRKELVKKTGMFEIYGAQVMPEGVFKSSGHLDSFNDPVTQCAKCNSIHRVDKLLEALTKNHYPEAMSNEQFTKELRAHNAKCPKCKGELSDVKKFNMMVKIDVGVAGKQSCYLRPETCQSIFVDFQRIMKTMRLKLPKGIAQVGRSFRNEISPRQSLLRQVEFSQMEAEVFFDPAKIDEIDGFDSIADYGLRLCRIGKDAETVKVKDAISKKVVSGKLIGYFMAQTQKFFESCGISVEKMRFREVAKDERPFYSKETWDFEVETSVGWLELVANNYRTDYDLKGHAEGSKQDLYYLDPQTNKKFIPHVWEISIGVDRTFYTILEHSLILEKRGQDERAVLKIPNALAPLHVAVFPLLSNKPELLKMAKEVYAGLNELYDAFYDESGSIGKRYARMDEVGVPYCITIDFDSLTNNDVTIRDRDSGKQERIKTASIKDLLHELIVGRKKL